MLYNTGRTSAAKWTPKFARSHWRDPSAVPEEVGIGVLTPDINVESFHEPERKMRHSVACG